MNWLVNTYPPLPEARQPGGYTASEMLSYADAAVALHASKTRLDQFIEDFEAAEKDTKVQALRVAYGLAMKHGAAEGGDPTTELYMTPTMLANVIADALAASPSCKQGAQS